MYKTSFEKAIITIGAFWSILWAVLGAFVFVDDRLAVYMVGLGIMVMMLPNAEI